MFKIEVKDLNILKRNEILITTILIIMIVGILLGVVIFDNKSKMTSSDKVENTESLIVNIQEDKQEYIDISELEQNIIVEEDNQEVENTDKNNTTNTNNTITNKNNSSGTPYYIKVNYGAQVVTIYKKDSEGNYTIPVKAMICSTGEYTPKSGVYKIQSRWEWLRLEGYVFGHYSTQIVGNILFHSVPYLEKGNLGSIEYWEYDKLGTDASAGCVRLTVADAIWIYNNCERGTKVEFYSSSNPGPLGKPVARKISNAPGDLKNWDPTDPNSNNPWKNYKEEQKEIINQIKNETINEQQNEVVNETTKEEQNKVINEIVNEITKEEQNEVVNEIINEQQNETINEIVDKQENEEKQVINEITDN